MLTLHLSGSPLTATQGDLTHLQREFLLEALAYRASARQRAPGDASTASGRPARYPRARLARAPRPRR